MTSVLFEDRLFEVEMGEAEAPKAAPAGEAKTFRRYDQSQCYLLPPSLDEWLDEDDEARFVSEVVENLLDLSPVYSSYESASGAPPYEPRMMLKLLLYAYATGVTSSPRDRAPLQARHRLQMAGGEHRTGLPLDQPLSPPSPRHAAAALPPGARPVRESRTRATRARRS